MIEVIIGTSFENSESSSVEAGATACKLQKTVVPICSHGHPTKVTLSSGQSFTVSIPFLSNLPTQHQAQPNSFLFISLRQRAGPASCHILSEAESIRLPSLSFKFFTVPSK